MKVKTWFNYAPEDHVYSPDPISVTVPDMSYDIRDLLERFTTGSIDPDIVRAVMYTDNPDFDDFLDTELGDFDLVDCDREINKLRELHSIRMERRKSVENLVEVSDDQAPSE